MVGPQSSKLMMRVRSPSPAPRSTGKCTRWVRSGYRRAVTQCKAAGARVIPSVCLSRTMPAVPIMFRTISRCHPRGEGIQQFDAGWSSLAARWAHNPKVAGSNPAPATTYRDDRVASLARTAGQTGNPFLLQHLLRGGAVWQLVGLITRRS